MRITPEQIYTLVGLKVGDKVKIKGFPIDNPFTLTKNNLFNNNLIAYDVSILIKNIFEKVESEIWDIREIERGSKYYHVSSNLLIIAEWYDIHKFDIDIITKGIAFKTKKYAQEYKEKLIEFNEKYKEGCG